MIGESNPSIAGAAQSQYISVGLTPNTTYYFAIKSQDEIPNISALSNILQIKTLAETVTDGTIIYERTNQIYTDINLDNSTTLDKLFNLW